MKKWKRIGIACVGILALGGSIVGLSACSAMGAKPKGQRLERMQASPQWHEASFRNRLPTEVAPTLKIIGAAITDSSPHTTPKQPIATELRQRSDFDQPPISGLRVTWLGHSTMIVEIDGRRALIDPVWGKRASPIRWLGPARWYPSPLALDQLPEVDVIVISHDHYDHLDDITVKALLDKPIIWLVPLGVGAHLEAWGMPTERIVELDWWESKTVNGITYTATPARHFSGRSLSDRDTQGGPTLWAGWSIAGPQHRAYYSGDTALFDELVDIGEKLGPFDLTMIETGAYNTLWRDVHLGPEQAVLAHQLVKGKVMLPVHWGMFNLSLHGWTEPAERVRVAAKQHNVRLIMPRPGGMVEPARASGPPQWWPELPWQNAKQAPVTSSAVEHLFDER